MKSTPGRNRIGRLPILILLPALLFAWADWRSAVTGHFEVFYKPGYESSAVLTAALLANYRPDVADLTGATPDLTRFAIEDIGTMSNGLTNPLYARIGLFSYEADPWSVIGFAQNWWRQVGLHEYIHMSHLTNSGGLPAALVAIFGSALHPNLLSPTWIIEGITTFGESQFSPYEGRLNDGFFDAYIAARAAERKFPSLLDATYLPMEYPYLAGSYLYGGEFFNYLAGRSRKGKFARMFNDNGSSCLSYCNPCLPALSLDMLAGRYYRADFHNLFLRWTLDVTARYRSWRVDGEELTRKGGTISFLTRDQDKLYYLRERTVKTGAARSFDFADIIERDMTTQHERTVASPLVTALNPIHVRQGRLYYPAADLAPGFANSSYLGFGFVSSLHVRDLATGRDRVLLRDRLRCFGVMADGRIIYTRDRRDRFGSEVLLWSPQTGRADESFSTDMLIGEIEADENRVVVVARHDWENWNIYVLDVCSRSFQPIVTTPLKESSIHLQGDKLFFTANYDKVYSSYMYDFTTATFCRLTEGGFADWPVYDAGRGELYFSGLNSGGNDIYRKKVGLTIPFVPPETLNSDKPALPDVSNELRSGGYASILPSLLPTIHVPFVLPHDTSFTSFDIGAYLMGSDVTGEHTYDLELALPISAAQRPAIGIPAFNLNYSSLFFAPVTASVQVSNYPNLGDLTIRYPVFIRPDWPLNRVDVGLEAAVSDPALKHRAVVPSIHAGFAIPGTELDATAALLAENRLWGSNRDLSLLDVTLAGRQYLANSELRFSIEGVTANHAVPLTIRGFSDSLPVRTGAIASVEFSMPLVKIRNGIWSPNIYFDDLCGSVFGDFAVGLGGRPRAFVAGVLKPEFGLLFLDVARFVPVVGFGINSELVPQAYIGFEIGSWLTSGLRTRHRVVDLVTGKGRAGLQNRWPLSASCWPLR